MADGIISLEDIGLSKAMFYDLELTVMRPDGRTDMVRTRSPFVPGEGSRIAVRMRVPVMDQPAWADRWTEDTVFYRVVGRPSLFIDEVSGDSAAPEVTIECDVKREDP